jgi:Tol biopolymer transport system component
MTKKISLMIVAMLALAGSIMASNNPLWLRYPAISPDGKTVVFEYQGDLYKVPTNGGQAIALTTNKAYDYNPVWSPDSKTIAFASDRYGNFDVYTMPIEGGTPMRLTYNSAREIPSSFTPDGKTVLFSANISDSKENVMFESAGGELYAVPATGGRDYQVLTIPATHAVYSKDMSTLIFQDKKGYENVWRKHHTSAVTRDIWAYNTKTKRYTQLSDFKGEDLNPVLAYDQKTLIYLSEQSGSINVWSLDINNPTKKTQLTSYKNHPVRFVSADKYNTLCYAFHGELYTQKEGIKAEKININLVKDMSENPVSFNIARAGAKGMSISPSGKEVAFIVRGEVFVTSTEYGTTKRITNTPEQERSASFSPDGKAVLYASERNGSWNIYQTTIVRSEEKLFCNSTLLKEEPILEVKEETFQPSYSPDGKEVAYLQERTILKVINLKSKKTRTILEGKWNYSYTDGDQHYQWSPDGKWFLTNIYPHTLFVSDVALISSNGNKKVINLTESGYSDAGASWSMKGNTMIWFTDRQGYRSHGSWGAEEDIFAMFFNEKTFDEFNLSKEERELNKEAEKEAKKVKEEKEDKKKKKSKKKDKKKDKKKKEIQTIKIELDNIQDRTIRLTINSSNIASALLTPDGKKLFYMSSFEKGYDLWVHDFVKKSTKKLVKLNGWGGNMQFDKDAKNIFLMSSGSIIKIDVATTKQKHISYSAEFNLNKAAEREYMFEHVWRQVKKKFYDPTIHGLDWGFYKKEYAKFLPHINNNYDFAEMLSELLGELNASHTGASYRARMKNGDRTAKLGAFYDSSYKGEGLKISEILKKGPLTKADTKIKVGIIIKKIDGQIISKNKSFYPLLNHKTGKKVLLSLYNPKTKKSWEEVVKPTSAGYENHLLYERWVKSRQAECDRLSGGKIGYVHVKGMDSQSFRKTYSEMLGKYGTADAIIVDTRFNGGGWLHDDLITLLSGKKYAEFCPRGLDMGSEPANKWKKPSAVLVCEGNYSDACGFPYAYQTLGIGKLVGMPVPGTMTAVWWEPLLDSSIIFGIPQVGIKNLEGNYVENIQIEPEIKVRNEYEKVTKGIDQQLKAAVDHLLKEIKK